MPNKAGKDDLDAAVARTVKLANLSFDEAGMRRFVSKASSVLKYVAQLNELKTEGVTPTSHAVEFDATLREDVSTRSDMHKKILDLAPERDGPYVQVPKVIESE